VAVSRFSTRSACERSDTAVRWVAPPVGVKATLMRSFTRCARLSERRAAFVNRSFRSAAACWPAPRRRWTSSGTSGRR